MDCEDDYHSFTPKLQLRRHRIKPRGSIHRLEAAYVNTGRPKEETPSTTKSNNPNPVPSARMPCSLALARSYHGQFGAEFAVGTAVTPPVPCW